MAQEAQKQDGKTPIKFDESAGDVTTPEPTPEPGSGSAALQVGAGLLLAVLANIAAVF